MSEKLKPISLKDACPECSKIIQSDDSSKKMKDKSMIRKCPYCGYIFIDERWEEPAFYDEFPLTKKRLILTTISSAMIFAIYASIFALLFIFFFKLSLIVVLYIALAAFVLSFLLFISQGLRDMDKNNREIHEDYLYSEQRMSVPSYAALLKEYGYRVPERFLKNTQSYSGKSEKELARIALHDLNQHYEKS